MCSVLVTLAVVGATELDAAVLARVAFHFRMTYHVDGQVALLLEGHFTQRAGVVLPLLVYEPVTLQDRRGGEALAALWTRVRLLF